MVELMNKMASHKYGEFKQEQTDYYQNKLRKKIFWLVLYTDKNTKDDFENIDVVKYHENLLFEISNYNALLFYPNDFVEIINTLSERMQETSDIKSVSGWAVGWQSDLYVRALQNH